MTVLTDPQGATFVASRYVPENRDLRSPGGRPRRSRLGLVGGSVAVRQRTEGPAPQGLLSGRSSRERRRSFGWCGQSMRSVEGEHRWEDDNDRGGQQGESGKVGGLPALEPVERAAPGEESGRWPGGTGQVARRTRLRPSAAVRFGVNPRSPTRVIMEPSTMRSSTRALTTATSWMPSIHSGDVDGSRADIPYRTSPGTTSRRASKVLRLAIRRAAEARSRRRRRRRRPASLRTAA